MSRRDIPINPCQCGCGKKTKIARYTDRGRGYIKGKPLKFLQGHSVANAKRGREHFNYKGGRYTFTNGYIMVHSPNSPMANCDGYVLEHRLVMAEHIGRPLTRDEHIHHLNGNVQDNRVDNLEIVSRSQHRIMHATKWDKEKVIRAFLDFRSTFGKMPKSYHPNTISGLPSHGCVERIFGSWENAVDIILSSD